MASPFPPNFLVNTTGPPPLSNNTSSLWDWVAWGIDLLPQEPLKEYLPQGSLKEYLPEHLPLTLRNYFNTTYTKGKDLVYDIYDDIVEEVGGKTEDNISEFEHLLRDFQDRVLALYDTHLGQFYDLAAETEEEIFNTNVELKGLREKFDALEKEVEIEQSEEAGLPDVFENQIQKLITAGRQMLTVVNQGKEIFFTKMRQTEVELYKLNLILADSSAELKTKLNSLFEAMAKIDLQKIGEEELPRDLN